jgi:nitrite reductase (NO-forming)
VPTRRELLWGLAGTTVAVTAGAVVRGVREARDSVRTARGGLAGARLEGPQGEVHSPYGHGAEPPTALGPAALDALTIPPPMTRGAVSRTITITQRPVEVAQGVVMDGWTFDGTIPGPILRVTEGETLTLTVRNLTAHPHNLHTHGAHAPAQDGWEPIPPGGERTYEIAPRPFGVYPYHCDLVPGAQHLGRGLHGLMLVDPPGGRAPAAERVLVLGGYDVDGDGRSDLFGMERCRRLLRAGIRSRCAAASSCDSMSRTSSSMSPSRPSICMRTPSTCSVPGHASSRTSTPTWWRSPWASAPCSRCDSPSRGA